MSFKKLTLTASCKTKPHCENRIVSYEELSRLSFDQRWTGQILCSTSGRTGKCWQSADVFMIRTLCCSDYHQQVTGCGVGLNWMKGCLDEVLQETENLLSRSCSSLFWSCDQYRIWLSKWCYWIIAQLHQQAVSDIWHTIPDWPYSHISVLKAITARSPCRKIPNEPIKAPFLHPRLSVPDVGVEDSDVLDTAGTPAPPGPESAASPSWDNMLTPLTAAMGQKSWMRRTNKVSAVAFHTDS